MEKKQGNVKCISRDHWWLLVLDPFVQMAFGCALLYIRLAAFLSAVSNSCRRIIFLQLPLLRLLAVLAISPVSCSSSTSVTFKRDSRCIDHIIYCYYNYSLM
ncbi:PREDICTED: uncharacterized protein LOC105364698 [Ceratosolen solmsi marchali]|uniref:Uncharacterized protein LOC105364698 n=1 Tax=Ceratosolen solmsi marchali TaxID=326594 RepID=A0AAJ6YMT7_9HYME|nr:PREDICTED: uncharacterized protein LOC105364698 [Ceratosolen solmsi marchali]